MSVCASICNCSPSRAVAVLVFLCIINLIIVGAVVVVG